MFVSYGEDGGSGCALRFSTSILAESTGILKKLAISGDSMIDSLEARDEMIFLNDEIAVNDMNLRNGFDARGIKDGDMVLVHSSFKSV